MKKEIHPEMFDVVAGCACGSTFKTRSTVDQIHVTLCSQCHPFFTGQVKFVDSAGRIEKFKKKFEKSNKK